MTRWISGALIVVGSLSACDLPQDLRQVEQLVALGGNPEQHVVFYTCRDGTGAPARPNPRRRAEQCYLKEQEGFAVMKWDRSGRLERVERAWDFGKDTTTEARRRWAEVRDSLVAAFGKARPATTCTEPVNAVAWIQVWGWRLAHADVLVLAKADTMGLAVGLTASAVPLNTCSEVKRPAA
jgi:hypothetical protein